VYALDATTGDQLWVFETRGATMASPVVAGDTVFIGSEDTNLYAVDTVTGEKKWHFKTGGKLGDRRLGYSPPVVSDGSVYIGSLDCHLYAIDIDSGVKQWEFETKKRISTTPRIEDGIVYYATRGHNLYALEANIGVEQWRFFAEDLLNSLSPVYDGTIYAGSTDKHLYAISVGRKREAITPGLQSGNSNRSGAGEQRQQNQEISDELAQSLASSSKSEMKRHLQGMDPYKFEHLIAELWNFQGYETTVRQGSSDRGIDIEAEKNEPFSEKILIQAKRYSDDNKVGSNEIRNYATLYQQVPDTDSVVIATTSQFTTEAGVLAKDLDVKTVNFNSLYNLINSWTDNYGL